MSLQKVLRSGILLGVIASFVSSCSNSGSPSSEQAFLYPVNAPAPSATAGGRIGELMKSTAEVKRSGIATGWGDEVRSAISYRNFVRSASKPTAVSIIRYNDTAGAKVMGVNRSMRGQEMQKAAGGLVEWGMSGSWGTVSNHWWRGGRFVVGKKGRDYEIKVKNLSEVRLEFVLSVDGLDVIDGKSASTKKRGYLIDPGKTVVVKGFRTSEEKVAAFQFSTVDHSYARLRHGDTRNVGVVGLALFTEKGREPGTEGRRRREAKAFAEAPNVRARN